MMNIKNYKVNHYIDEFQNYCKQIYEKYLQMEKTLDIEDKVEALWKITEEFCDYLTYKNCYSNKKIEALKKVVSGIDVYKRQDGTCRENESACGGGAGGWYNPSLLV